jgi:hypothetical protein
MAEAPRGYGDTMTGIEDELRRRDDKREHARRPEADGVPAEEQMSQADVEERLDEDPERVTNRRDVPDTPENSIEARTEDQPE